jgi:DNA-directed RNA polymerase subunit RPC12/RpoP
METTQTRVPERRADPCSLCGGDHSERWCHQHDEDDDTHCPQCGEEIILMAPDSIGQCRNCHYRTEEGRNEP